MKSDIVTVFDDWFAGKARMIHTALPGVIDSYEGHGTKKARVKIMIKLRARDGETLSIPPIDNVPVIFPSSEKFSLLFPLKKGDGCLIIFAEEGIGAFLKGDTEVDSDSLARFSLTDAICIPGLWSFKTIPESVATIEINEEGHILLNGEDKSFVTYAELDSALQSLITALSTHVHTGVTSGGASSGPPPSPFSLDISAAETETIKTGG